MAKQSKKSETTLTITLRRPTNPKGGRQLHMTGKDGARLLKFAGVEEGTSLGRKVGRTLTLEVERVGTVLQGDTHSWWITHQSGEAKERLSQAFDALKPGGSFTVVITAATYNVDGGDDGGDAPSIADLLG